MKKTIMKNEHCTISLSSDSFKTRLELVFNDSPDTTYTFLKLPVTWWKKEESQ